MTSNIAPEARPLEPPVSVTPAVALASAALSTSLPATASKLSDGPVNATVKSCVAVAETLPWASVTCAESVAGPFASCTASLFGIVAVQPPPLPTVAV